MKMKNNEREKVSVQFIKELITEASEKTVRTGYLFFSDLDKFENPPSLEKILYLDEKSLSPVAKETLEFLEKYQGDNFSFNDFKWKLLAFVTVQDIFEALLLDDTAVRNVNVFRQWYFYYESKYILTESILCGLNGFYCATCSLMRLFLEFNLLQLYYYGLIKKNNNYNCLSEYLKANRNIKWGKLISRSLPKDNFCEPIKERIRLSLKAQSQYAAHPYHPEYSPKQFANMVPGPSLEGIFYWPAYIQIVLQSVLWGYYVNFPMLFHPVDILKKFGFNPPVGLFIDEVGGKIISKSLSPKDYKEFVDYSSKSKKVENLLSWYSSLKNLTEEEILATWNTREEGEIKDLIEGYCKNMTKLRGIKELLSFKFKNDQEIEAIDSKKLVSILDYSNWKNLYKKIKSRY